MTATGTDPSAKRPPLRGAAAVAWTVRLAVTYVIAFSGGWIALQVDLPLPWMLGPLFACGIVSVFGGRLIFAPHSRELGQVAIGLAVGMRFTPHVLVAAAALLPAMLAVTLYIMVFTAVAAFLFRPLANVDATTAFFATAAGGMADMAVVAAERGGDANAVSIVHALRVATVVSLVPLLVFAFGEHGTASPLSDLASRELWAVLLALAGAYLVARVLKPTFIPNPWLLGPILFGVVLGASGLFIVAVPPILIVLAQVMVGTWLGCRFRRELIMALPRVAFAGFAISLFMIACAAGGAAVLSAATGLPFSTSFLSLAPAAVTEMVITAKAMNVDAELVTAFHVMRIAVISSTILVVHNVYMRIRRSRDESRI